MIQFIAPSSYPVITFGPFASPNAVLISLSHAVGNSLNHLANAFLLFRDNCILSIVTFMVPRYVWKKGYKYCFKCYLFE